MPIPRPGVAGPTKEREAAMTQQYQGKRLAAALAVLGLLLAGGGCAALHVHGPDPACAPLPRELDKVNLPDYVIEPPDVLLIDAQRVVPKPPYHIDTGDVLFVRFPAQPLEPADQAVLEARGQTLEGVIAVDPEGTVNLGARFRTVTVLGMTLDQARSAIEARLEEEIPKREIVKKCKVVVELAQTRGLELIRGQHLVRPDGTVSLGIYGKVRLAGLTLDQAKAAIEQQLAQSLLRPEITVDVFGYNSKVYYVVIDLAGAGQQVIRLPSLGNETVLDAIGQINGLPPTTSKKQIWLARPAPVSSGCDQVLPIDWAAITQGAST